MASGGGGAATWQPQEEGLREICGLLEQQMAPTSDDKSMIWQRLQQYSQFPDFNNYLAFIFAQAELFQSPNTTLRKLSLSSVNEYIMLMPTPHLRNVIEYMLLVNKDSSDEVALEACEFWSAYCEAELPPENLREFLPCLLPILLSNMAYADDDESLLEAEAKLSATGDEAWKDREAAVLALGAIGEGCINGLYPHLSE
ncbi:UNVERIFIED_CONTAM: Transportin-1, partial [Sesamum radiatum]